MNFYEKNIQYLVKTNPSGMPEGLSTSFEVSPTVSDLQKIATSTRMSIDRLTSVDLEKEAGIKAIDIKLIILDVDGVLTDGGMYYTESGDEFKKFNTKDGMGIKERAKIGMNFGIISSGINETLIKRRADLLGISHVYVGKGAKLPVLKKWCAESLKIDLKNVAYVGDDINDLEVMKEVGLTACPADAVEVIQKTAMVRLSRNGGDACVREFLDRFFPMS